MLNERRIDKAIALLRGGWIRGTLFDVIDGKNVYCAEGAVRTTSTIFGGICLDPLWQALNQKCREIHDCGIVNFNDDHAESVDDVIALFEKVRADLDGPGCPP